MIRLLLNPERLSWSAARAHSLLILLVLPDSHRSISTSIPPLVFAGLATILIFWGMQRQDNAKLKKRSEQSEHERDLAQDELFRRLYEERELNKEKVQFQAQLTDCEKYAALDLEGKVSAGSTTSACHMPFTTSFGSPQTMRTHARAHRKVQEVADEAHQVLRKPSAPPVLIDTAEVVRRPESIDTQLSGT